MAEWMVHIIGGGRHLEDLPSWFDSPRLNVVGESGVYHVKSSEFDSFGFTDSASEKVRSYAVEKILPVINAVTKLRLSSETFNRVLTTGTVALIEDDGQVRIFNQIRHTVGFPLQFNKEPSNTSERIGQWTDLALDDELVWGALERFGTQTTGASLRQVYEFIEEDLGGHPNNVAKCVTATEEEIKRFKKAIQDPKYTGTDAAHASTPKRMTGDTYYPPMDLRKAEAFARKLVVDYLRWRVQSGGSSRL